jgi:hypothetical protein
MCRNKLLSTVDRLGLDFDLGIGVSGALSIPGFNVGGEFSIALTDKYSSEGSMLQKCLSVTITTKFGFGAGEATIGVGVVGAAGDKYWVGEGSTTATVGGINVALGEIGLGVSISKPAPGTNSGEGAGFGGSHPVGPGIGGSAHMYKGRSYTGKVCEDKHCWDLMDTLTNLKLLLRAKEAFDWAYEAGQKDNWGLAKIIPPSP